MTGENSKGITAAELLAELASDADYQRREAEWTASSRAYAMELREDERGLVSDLRRCGLRLDSIWDVIGAQALPSAAVSVTIRHLQQPHAPPTRQGIARVLAGGAPADRPRVRSALRQALSTERDQNVRDALYSSIGQLADPDHLDEILELLNDPGGGDARIMLVPALPRFGERGRAALEAMAQDPVLGAEARHQLHSAFRRPQKPDREAAPLGGDELISIALDRQQLPLFLDRLAAVLAIPSDAVDPVIDRVDSMRPEESASVRVVTSEGVPLRIEVFLDDVDAVDLFVFGPEPARTTLDRLARDFLETHP